MALAIVYLKVEKHQNFPVVKSTYSDIFQNTLKKMCSEDLLSLKNGEYIVSDKGLGILKKSIEAVDIIRQFDVFSSVIPRGLSSDEWLSSEDPAFVRWDIYDPRFNRDGNDESGKDMRLAVISWISEKLKDSSLKEIDLHEIVFMQKLGCGEFNDGHFYQRIIDGSIFEEIEDIVKGAFKWQGIDPDGDEEVASRNMQTLYTVGMLESRKRDAPPCGDCGIPLYCYEKECRENGTKLLNCPGCGKLFGNNSDIKKYTCPKCSYVIYEGDCVCGGCGALIDLGLPIGSIATDSYTETTPVYSYDYGYVSYGWVNPYDVMVSYLVFDSLYYSIW